MSPINIKSVILIYDKVLARYGELAGFAQSGEGGLESAL